MKQYLLITVKDSLQSDPQQTVAQLSDGNIYFSLPGAGNADAVMQEVLNHLAQSGWQLLQVLQCGGEFRMFFETNGISA